MLVLASVQALLDRAREHLSAADLPALVMNDPGHAAYVAAYARVLADGAGALFEHDAEGAPRIGSFDVTENLLAAHANAERSTTHRWFSALASAIELLGAAAYRDVALSATLGGAIADAFALDAADAPGAPVDLLPRVCRELKESRSDPRERALALLGEVLTADLTDADTEVACHELLSRHEEFQSWYCDDGERNPYYAARPEFLWGAVVERRDLPTWLALVDERFPTSPDVASRARERLLREGRAWLGR